MEVNQCKAHLAAHTGDKQLVLTYLHGDDASKQRWEIIQEQLRYVFDFQNSDFFFSLIFRRAEHQVAALEQTISSYGEDVEKYARGQVESSRRMLEMNEELEKYRALLGSNSSPELVDLKRLLKEKEGELEKLRLLEMQRGEVRSAVLALWIGQNTD